MPNSTKKTKLTYFYTDNSKITKTNITVSFEEKGIIVREKCNLHEEGLKEGLTASQLYLFAAQNDIRANRLKFCEKYNLYNDFFIPQDEVGKFIACLNAEYPNLTLINTLKEKYLPNQVIPMIHTNKEGTWSLHYPTTAP